MDIVKLVNDCRLAYKNCYRPHTSGPEWPKTEKGFFNVKMYYEKNGEKSGYPLNPGEQKPQKGKTNPAHLLPKEGSEKAARNIDQHYQEIAEKLKQEAALVEKGIFKVVGAGRSTRYEIAMR